MQSKLVKNLLRKLNKVKTKFIIIVYCNISAIKVAIIKQKYLKKIRIHNKNKF